MDTLAHLGMTVHVLGLLLLFLAAGPAIRRGREAWGQKDVLPAPETQPTLALVIPMTGDSPAMRASLTSLLDQPGWSFQALLTVRDETDTAASLARELTDRFPHARLVVAGAATHCCQKNHNLLAGIRAAGETPEILVFCDSTHEARPDFLTRLTRPLQSGEAALATTYHRVLPEDLRLPSLFHFFSALLIHLLQNLPWFRLPWGGATAIRREVFLRNGIDAIWARGIVDDFTMGPYLQRRGVRAAAAPDAALLTRPGRQSLQGWWGWWFRQLLYLKFCMPFTWLAATLAPLGGAALLGFTLADMLRGGLAGWLYLGGLCAAGALFGGLCQRRIPVWRAGPGFLLMQILTVPCYLATWLTNTLRWRGIAYRARLDGTVAAIVPSAQD
ncbi:MAG: glycosyltransferase [Humidesulfovibrio sp.]|nr:glycosyltransferase [Humidesulfovibrio sp.]